MKFDLLFKKIISYLGLGMSIIDLGLVINNRNAIEEAYNKGYKEGRYDQQADDRKILESGNNA